MIPELNLTIDRYATLTTELISQIIIDFDSSLTGFQANNEIIQIEIDGDIALNLSGYDQGLTVEVPANAVPITAEQIQQLTAQMQITAPQP